ncbi:hypothetical protein D3C72_2216170 [compost metagenome]
MMEWGPQPETVKDFRVTAFFANPETPARQVLSIQDNYQRQIASQINLKHVVKLRVDIASTNGLNHTRIFEIRCYE